MNAAQNKKHVFVIFLKFIYTYRFKSTYYK